MPARLQAEFSAVNNEKDATKGLQPENFLLSPVTHGGPRVSTFFFKELQGRNCVTNKIKADWSLTSNSDCEASFVCSAVNTFYIFSALCVFFLTLCEPPNAPFPHFHFTSSSFWSNEMRAVTVFAYRGSRSLLSSEARPLAAACLVGLHVLSHRFISLYNK